MSRTRIFITITGVIALTLATFTGIAGAAQNETNCTFNGTATLHSGFPATEGSGSFEGTINCVGTVNISGELTADFEYNEPVSTCPLQGDANTVDASDGFEIDTNPAANDGPEYTGDFEWDRVGATAAITISNVNSVGNTQFTNGSGSGTAAFEPDEGPDAVATRCLDPDAAGDPLTATVEGAAAIADTN